MIIIFLNLILAYPWDHLLGDSYLDENLSLFLDLANYRMHADRFLNYIIADFFLLLIASAQVNDFDLYDYKI